ncbi:MAG: YHYH protein [Chitinophagia bacterium]|nr:YHYH protein [Chitinophagia bacterium]
MPLKLSNSGGEESLDTQICHMKNIFFSFSIAFIFSMILLMKGMAHPGGHYSESDKSYLNTWSLQNGETFKGNFSRADEQNLYLENESGVFSVPMRSLTEQDRNLALFKMARLEKLNQSLSIEPEQKAGFHQNWLLVGMVSLIMLLLLAPQKRKVLFLFGGLVFVYACSKAVGSTPSAPSITVIPKTRTTFLDSAFNDFKPAISTRSDNQYYYVASSGIPAHDKMIGITSWQQQVPIPQAYEGSNSWSIPLQPEYATVPLSTKTNLMKGAVAIAVNGIPIFNALNNRGEDSYIIGELDKWGGHCGRADDYHYHAAPMHLSGSNNTLPIAFGLDGFAVYGLKEPDGSVMATLDTCHGHVLNNGVYHYHGTTNYPYVIGAMRGKVNLDPATPAPENQILPQAFAKPARPALTPLKDAVITDFKAVGSNGFSLTYKIGVKNGYVNYSWDGNNRFTYTLIDTAGRSTTNSYQR